MKNLNCGFNFFSGETSKWQHNASEELICAKKLQPPANAAT
jgi:hypothetical protein